MYTDRILAIYWGNQENNKFQIWLFNATLLVEKNLGENDMFV